MSCFRKKEIFREKLKIKLQLYEFDVDEGEGFKNDNEKKIRGKD